MNQHHRLARMNIALPKRLRKDTREAIESAIEHHHDAMEALSAILDLFDGDTDLEPSLGFQDPAVENIDQDYIACGSRTDLEEDVHDEPHDQADEGNDEPSLAHTNDMNQERATQHLERVWGSASDFEAEHDGREPSEDLEPEDYHP